MKFVKKSLHNQRLNVNACYHVNPFSIPIEVMDCTANKLNMYLFSEIIINIDRDVLLSPNTLLGYTNDLIFLRLVYDYGSRI